MKRLGWLIIDFCGTEAIGPRRRRNLCADLFSGDVRSLIGTARATDSIEPVLLILLLSNRSSPRP